MNSLIQQIITDNSDTFCRILGEITSGVGGSINLLNGNGGCNGKTTLLQQLKKTYGGVYHLDNNLSNIHDLQTVSDIKVLFISENFNILDHIVTLQQLSSQYHIFIDQNNVDVVTISKAINDINIYNCNNRFNYDVNLCNTLNEIKVL
jgi:hypothetical protein